MEFDESRVYTALNADELKVGSKVICANCLTNLKEYVADYFNEGVDNTCIIASILDETFGNRFQNDICNYSLAYLVSEPEEKKLKWTDLKIGDIVHEKDGTDTRMVTVIDTSNEPDEEGDILHVCLGDWWPSDDELEDWEKVE